MLYRLARILQFIGLLILPVAIAGQMQDRLTLKDMLFVSGVGIAVFTIGWLMQQAVRPR